MPDIGPRSESTQAAPRFEWGAIWAGVFTFVAIWSVFGLLGVAIFSRNAVASNPNPLESSSPLSMGWGVWSIVLTIVSMYVAGRETGRLAHVSTRHDGVVHGMVMFGLSVVAGVVITTIGGAALAGASPAPATAHSPYLLTVFADLGWIGFVALFLGWVGAMFGASSGIMHKAQTSTVRDIRPAA